MKTGQQIFPQQRFNVSLFVLTTFLQALSWAFGASAVFAAEFIRWGLIICLIHIITSYWQKNDTNLEPTGGKVLVAWQILLLIGIVRGCFEIYDYWSAKQLIQSSFDLCITLMAVVFANRHIARSWIKFWTTYAIPFFLFALFFKGAQGFTHFSFGMFFLPACFIPMLPRRWAWLMSALMLYMLGFYVTDRAQGMKVAFSLTLSFMWFARKTIRNTYIRFAHHLTYITTILLVVLYVTGTYNVFADSEKTYSGVATTEIVTLSGDTKTEDLTSDTRSKIYDDVIESAIENDYVWFGRTPARGNDNTVGIGDLMIELGVSIYAERPKNEVCFPNIFTWLGMVGMIVYILIYMTASWLAINRSRSKALKLLGLFIAFHFFLGWMEDNNRWDNNNVVIWLAIGMCLSRDFRNMTDIDFKAWLRSCLPSKICGIKMQ